MPFYDGLVLKPPDSLVNNIQERGSIRNVKYDILMVSLKLSLKSNLIKSC